MIVTMHRWLITMALMLVLLGSTAALAAGGGDGGSSGSKNMALREAQALIAKNQYEQALEKLQTVVAKDSGNADAWNLIGFSNRELKNFDKALDGYSKALASNPRHTGAIEYLGELYLDLGDLEQAEQQLAKLDDICFFGCEDYDTLKASIAKYKAAQGM